MTKEEDRMQIVIEIPKGAYDLLRDKGVDWLGAEHILNAVANGTPLPKGHGNLKDVDPIIDRLQKTRTYSLQQAIDIETFKKDLMNAQTIIEADKAESEDT